MAEFNVIQQCKNCTLLKTPTIYLCDINSTRMTYFFNLSIDIHISYKFTSFDKNKADQLTDLFHSFSNMFSAWRCLPVQSVAFPSFTSRSTSSIVRRRRRALFKALNDPSTNPAKLQRLREKAARPGKDLLKYIAETRVARVQTQEDRKKLWYDLRYNRYAPLFLGQIKPRMKLWAAALHEEQLPLARLPEVAVCGRSNSGKSTLINYLCGQYCANMRRAPGSTMELYFWQVGRPAQLCLVDLPGYGFAEAPDEKRLQWTEFTLWYIRARKNLKRVLLLIDGRQGLKPSDRELLT